MQRNLFPAQFDNNYRGHWLGIALFVLILMLELVIGANSIIHTRSVAMGADGIPLDNFSNGGAQAVVALFALLGVWRLLFGLLGIVALIRYRAMIPFLYLLLLILQLGSRAVQVLRPLDASATQTGSIVIYVLLGTIFLGFVLSLVGKRNTAQPQPT